MKITTNNFIQVIWESNISLKMKKDIINNLDKISFERFEEIYFILKKNVEEQKKVIKKFRQKNKMLNLKFEVKMKSEMAKFY